MTANPRESVKYHLTNEIIDYIDTYGPTDIDTLCIELDVTADQFRKARYSLPGMLAMEDRDVTIPRPTRLDGFMYKLADGVRTATAEDGEPNMQKAFGDLLTRVATIYLDVEKLVAIAPSRSAVRKMLRKLQRSLDGTLDRAEDVAMEADAAISPKARHVLERIA